MGRGMCADGKVINYEDEAIIIYVIRFHIQTYTDMRLSQICVCVCECVCMRVYEYMY